jgi:hypothetical protein
MGSAPMERFSDSTLADFHEGGGLVARDMEEEE